MTWAAEKREIRSGALKNSDAGGCDEEGIGQNALKTGDWVRDLINAGRNERDLSR